MKKRVVLLLMSFLLIFSANFFIPRLMPGDPFRYTSAVSGEDIETAYSQEQIDNLKSYYGLDKPLFQQYISYSRGLLTGDLGMSIYYKKPVLTVLLERFPWSMYIMLVSLLISLVLGTSIALATLKRKRLDNIIYLVFSSICEVPSFLIAILVLFLIGAKTSWLPLSTNVTPFVSHSNLTEWIGDVVLHSIMPVLSMVLVTLPGFYFTSRAAFLNVLEKPYMNTAKSKGLKTARVNKKYILKNSSSAIVAKFFLSVSTAVGATLLIENVFAYPGIGKTLKDAVMYRDFPMIQGVFLFSSLLVMVCIFISDCINKRGMKRSI